MIARFWQPAIVSWNEETEGEEEEKEKRKDKKCRKKANNEMKEEKEKGETLPRDSYSSISCTSEDMGTFTLAARDASCNQVTITLMMETVRLSGSLPAAEAFPVPPAAFAPSAPSAPSAPAATVPVWNGFAAIPYLVLKPIFG